MRRAAWLTASLLTAAAPLAADRDRAPQASPPLLVVLITVDQLRGDYLDRFAGQLTGGYGWLRDGAFFTHAAQDHAIPVTAAGHSTVLSGRHPVSTGILRNDEGVPDPNSPLIGTAGPGASPYRFRGTALIDWMQARWPRSRALSVSRKDRGAILPMGRGHRHQVYWYDNGQFTTSRWYANALPGWLRAFNHTMEPGRFVGRPWNLLLPAGEYAEPDSMPYENFGRDLTFPHPGLPADTALARRRMVSAPFIDSLTLALALEGLNRLGLGRGPQPDLLAISLSQTDEIGHGWGPNSREIHDHVLRVDRWLGAFLDSLGRLRDPARIVVALTADHGVHAFPEWAQANGLPRRYVDVDSVLRRYRSRVRAIAGDTLVRPFPYREYGLVALDRNDLRSYGINADSLVDALAADLRRVPGVMRVDTRATIAGGDTTDMVVRRWQHMLFPEVPVGVLITLDDGNVFAPGRGNARHGDLSTEGSWVTLAFRGEGIRAGRYDGRVSTVDIAPTLAALLGIEPTEPVQGRILHEALLR